MDMSEECHKEGGLRFFDTNDDDEKQREQRTWTRTIERRKIDK